VTWGTKGGQDLDESKPKLSKFGLLKDVDMGVRRRSGIVVRCFMIPLRNRCNGPRIVIPLGDLSVMPIHDAMMS
jgi:hypothetical protein